MMAGDDKGVSSIEAPAEWMASASCTRIDVDPEWWFTPASDVEARQLAVAHCLACPVTVSCHDHVIRHPSITDGIWAGLTVRQIRYPRRNT